jgi:hypothetical protein
MIVMKRWFADGPSNTAGEDGKIFEATDVLYNRIKLICRAGMCAGFHAIDMFGCCTGLR